MNRKICVAWIRERTKHKYKQVKPFSGFVAWTLRLLEVSIVCKVTLFYVPREALNLFREFHRCNSSGSNWRQGSSADSYSRIANVISSISIAFFNVKPQLTVSLLCHATWNNYVERLNSAAMLDATSNPKSISIATSDFVRAQTQ